MFHSPDRGAMRRQFAAAWQRVKRGEAASDLDRQIAAVIDWHPEYHDLIGSSEALERNFTPEEGQTNPFLHLGLHLAVRDQLATDRPAGVRDIFQRIRSALGDEHAAEHLLLERLGETLHAAQVSGMPPDERQYLDALREDASRLATRRDRGAR